MDQVMVKITGYWDYVTRAGDTYDMLAIAAYDNEKLASYIIQANPLYMGVLMFEAGIKIKIPILDTTTVPSTLPPWRR